MLTVKAMGERVGEAAFLRQLDVLRSRTDSRPDLARIACPTLLVAGRDDPGDAGRRSRRDKACATRCDLDGSRVWSLQPARAAGGRQRRRCAAGWRAEMRENPYSHCLATW